MQGTKKLMIVLLVCMQTEQAFSFYNMSSRYEDEESSLGLWGSLSFLWWGAKQIYTFKKYIGGGTFLYMLAPAYAAVTLLASMNNRPKNTFALPFSRPLYTSKFGKKKNFSPVMAQQQMLLYGGLIALSGYGLYKLVS